MSGNVCPLPPHVIWGVLDKTVKVWYILLVSPPCWFAGRVRARHPGGLCVYIRTARVKANIYIDGFNLYYGCLNHSPYKWLDISKLCSMLLPNDTINRIRYFTALIKARPDDPQKPERQLTYLRALRTIPNLSIHLGSYATRRVRLPLVEPTPDGPRFAEVWRTDEKGSDVNLATYLLADGCYKDYEVAVIVSNDSDLSEAIRIVKTDFDLKVGVLLPISNSKRWASSKLVEAATFVKRIREGVLRQSLFPPTLTDSGGIITKPATW